MIGVAMVVAVDLATAPTLSSWAQSRWQAGRRIRSGRPSGLDESLYVRLRRDLGYRLNASGRGICDGRELDAQPMRLLAIDPFAEVRFAAT